jgi:hypothetical protein
MLRQTATGRVLIFTRTKHRAKNLARDLEKNSYRVSALQGNMTQNRRQDAINGFRDGKYDILVATDIASRGIDVSEISHVINYDMPNTVDAYTHRIGRTGRACQSGEAFTFAAQADETMVREIEHVLGARIERRRLPDFDYSSFTPESQPRQDRSYRTQQLYAMRTRGQNRGTTARPSPQGSSGRRATQPLHCTPAPQRRSSSRAGKNSPVTRGLEFRRLSVFGDKADLAKIYRFITSSDRTGCSCRLRRFSALHRQFPASRFGSADRVANAVPCTRGQGFPHPAQARREPFHRVGAEFRTLPHRLPTGGTGVPWGGAGRCRLKRSAIIPGIMNPIPMPRLAPVSPCDGAAVSRAIAAFIFRSLFTSSKTPSRLLVVDRLLHIGRRVIELMKRSVRPRPNW